VKKVKAKTEMYSQRNPKMCPLSAVVLYILVIIICTIH